MLIGTGKYAKEGSQAGVMNMFYQQNRTVSPYSAAAIFDPPPIDSFAASACNDHPAYMAGPPGYYPDKVNTYSAPESITRECLVAQNCTTL